MKSISREEEKIEKQIVLPIHAARYASIIATSSVRRNSTSIVDHFEPYSTNPSSCVNLSKLKDRLRELISCEYFFVHQEHSIVDIVLASLARCKLVTVHHNVEISGFSTVSPEDNLPQSVTDAIVQRNFDYALTNHVCESITTNGAQTDAATELASRFMPSGVLNLLISTVATDPNVLGHKGNVGDNFGLWITLHLTSLPVIPVGTWFDKAKPLFLTVGSIMQHARNRGAVWGSGCIVEMPWKTDPVPTDSIYFGVRGPRSREQILRRYAINAPVIGDPGLLVTDIASRVRSVADIEIGFIIHGVDKNDFNQRYPGVFLVNNSGSYDVYCRDICRCKRVISSSLHGLIFSHALGIPCEIVAFGHRLSGGEFKFIDYMQSLGNYSFEQRVDLSVLTPSIGELCEMVDSAWVPDLHNLHDLQDAARRRFPFPRRLKEASDECK